MLYGKPQRKKFAVNAGSLTVHPVYLQHEDRILKNEVIQLSVDMTYADPDIRLGNVDRPTLRI